MIMKTRDTLSLKIKNGLTLVELIITLGILLVIISVVGMAFTSAMESFAVDRKLQDTEYDARLTLLAITRDIRRSEVSGWSELSMELTNTDGVVTYVYDNANRKLIRTVTGDSPVAFIPPTNLIDFSITGLIYDDGARDFIVLTPGTLSDPDDPGSPAVFPDRLTISLIIENEYQGKDEQNINTTISIKRIP